MLTGLASALALAAPASAAPSGRVLVAEFENDVNPVTQEYLIDAIHQAEDEGYAAVVIEMDTPGGLGSSMRDDREGDPRRRGAGRRLRRARQARAPTPRAP